LTEGQEISGIVNVVRDAEVELEEPTVIMLSLIHISEPTRPY